MKFKSIVSLCLITLSSFAQNNIHKAIQSEMQRALDSLRVEDAPAPFYIGTNLVDAKAYSIKSCWGSNVVKIETPLSILNHNQLFVGDYNEAGYNYNDATVDRLKNSHFRVNSDLNEDAIKRSLWMAYDDIIKFQAQKYNAKQSALEDDPTMALNHPDFTAVKAFELKLPIENKAFDTTFLVPLADKLSKVFVAYPHIKYSSVIITGIKGNVYFDNTEGTSAHYPFSGFRISVYAEAQTEKGETFWDQTALCYTNEKDFLSEELLIEKMHTIGRELEQLRFAEDFDDQYEGPILYESQAALEVFAQMSKDLKAQQKKIGGDDKFKSRYANTGKTNKMLGRRFADTSLTIVARPNLETYNEQALMGYAPIDMEGVEAVNDFPLIQSGILVGLLNNRNPSEGFKESNGHARLDVGSTYADINPSTIELSSSQPLNTGDIKKELIKLAAKEGLDYALIIRKVKIGSCSPLVAYRVDTKTGEESILKGLSVKKPSIKDFKKIKYTSDNKMVYNTMLSNYFSPANLNLSGSLSSFITYDALLFTGMEANKPRLSRSRVAPLESPLMLQNVK